MSPQSLVIIYSTKLITHLFLKFSFADATEVTTTKRKSEAGDAPDGTPAEGATPEKKAKISAEKEETEESTNGESNEVAA